MKMLIQLPRTGWLDRLILLASSIAFFAFQGLLTAQQLNNITDNRAQKRTTPKVRTAAGLLHSLPDPVDNHHLVRSMLDGETLQETFTWAQILRMSPKQHKRLLDDLQAFPCDSGTKDLLLKSVTLYGPPQPPREQLERIISVGRYSVTQNPMLNWAAREPDAALHWYLEKKESGALAPGIDNKLNQSVMSDLVLGLSRSNPDLAFELYRSTPKTEMHQRMPMWLASEFTEHKMRTGIATNLLKLIESHQGNDREQVLRGAIGQYGRNSKFNEGLAFVKKHDQSAKSQIKYIGHLFSYALGYEQVQDGLDWLHTIAMESQTPEIVGEIITNHLSGGGGIRELEAEDWLNKQPPGAIRDQGYAALSKARLNVRFFEKALRHAERIDNKNLRAATREMIKERWMEHDSEEAREGFASPSRVSETNPASRNPSGQATAEQTGKGQRIVRSETEDASSSDLQIERVCSILKDLEPVNLESTTDDLWMRIVQKNKAYRMVFLDFLRAVEGLRIEHLLEVAKNTQNKEFRRWLVLLAAEQDPIRIFHEETWKNVISITELFDAIARHDPATAIRLLPPQQPRDQDEGPVYLIMEPYLAARIRIATKLLAVDIDEGLEVILRIHENLNGANSGRIPMGLFGALATPAIPSESVTGLIEAIGKPQYANIKIDLISMTVNHAMFNGGVLVAIQCVESMQLTANDLEHAIIRIIKLGGLDTNPVGLANWISNVQPNTIPSVLEDWSETDFKAAADWLHGQENAMAWARGVRDDEVKNELVKRLSGEQ